jgi:hypothetical protein
VLIEECFTDAAPARVPAGGVELRWEGQRAAAGKRALRGRTAGDLIVAMDAPSGAEPESMVGQIVQARVDRSAALLLHGSVLPKTAVVGVL